MDFDQIILALKLVQTDPVQSTLLFRMFFTKDKTNRVVLDALCKVLQDVVVSRNAPNHGVQVARLDRVTCTSFTHDEEALQVVSRLLPCRPYEIYGSPRDAWS